MELASSTVDFDDGRYQLQLTPSADFHLDVGYALVDDDGDRATGALPIDLKVSLTGDSAGNTINGTSGNDLLLGKTATTSSMVSAAMTSWLVAWVPTP